MVDAQGAMWPSADAATAVRARNVVLARDGRPVVRIEALDIPSGATTALVGPNGSGKTTLLHAIAGLLPASSGALGVLGTTPRRARHRVAYVLQATAVSEHLPVTVREVVAMGRYAARGVLGRFSAGDRAAVDRALADLDLASLAGRHLGELSGGQRQRALVAQGLAQEGELVLLDEPLSALDHVSVEQIRSVLHDLRAKGRTTIVATHDLAEARAADHVVLLAGRVVASGPPRSAITRDTLADAYGNRLVRLGHDTFVMDDASHHDD